jgi:type IV pilus assembly protein PilE
MQPSFDAICPRARGLTLIELVVVVAIVALLATMAVPSYRSYLLRSHRVEAKAALLGLAVAQERFYLQHNRYAADAELDAAPPAGLGLRTTSERGLYAIAIDQADAAGFTASATAIGPQADDAQCAVFTMNQTDEKGGTSTECWDR